MNNFTFRPGKKPKVFDSRNLKLCKYLPFDTPIILPESINWGSKVKNWPMYLNDTLGDCTLAGVGHSIQTWTFNSSSIYSLTDADILKYYELLGGYNPQDPSTDGGCVELDVLKYWKNTGFNGHLINSFVEVNLNNIQEVKSAIYLFGLIYIGLQLPNIATTQDIWDVSINDGGCAGGHAIIIIGFDSQYLYGITWGMVKKITYPFFNMYCDESYAIISNDWLNNAGISPSNLNLSALKSDLKLVK
jgi:hypothetical protein